MSETPLDSIPQIIDNDSFGRWLRLLKGESGQQLACRAAMRVLPVGWDWLISSTGADVTLPMLTCAFYATNPPEKPTKKLPPNVQTALFYNADYSTRASAARNHSPASVLAAANSAATATTLPLTHAIRSAANAATSAASAYGYELTDSENIGNMALTREDFWAEIRNDCILMCENRDLQNRPLWAKQPSPFDAHWQRVKGALDGKPEWTDWLLWYDAALTGDPFSTDLLSPA